MKHYLFRHILNYTFCRKNAKFFIKKVVNLTTFLYLYVSNNKNIYAMNTGKNSNKNRNNVQSSNAGTTAALLVVAQDDKTQEVNPENKKLDQPSQEQTETLKATIDSFAPSAEERIKRMSNFQILANKHTHLKMKEEELQKFILSSDGQKEKIVLENSSGLKIEVTNSAVIAKVVGEMKGTLDNLISEVDSEIRTFVI